MRSKVRFILSSQQFRNFCAQTTQYIKEEAYSNIVFYPKNFVVMSEKDGYNHLYLYTSGGNLVKQLTKGNFEVKDFLGWDEATNTFYFESNEGSPLRSSIGSAVFGV